MAFCCLIVVFSDFVLLCVSWVCGVSVVSVLRGRLMLSGWLFVFWGGGLCEFRLVNFVGLVVAFAACTFALCAQCVLCCVFGRWIGGLWWVCLFRLRVLDLVYVVNVGGGVPGLLDLVAWFFVVCVGWVWFMADLVFGGFVVVVYVALGC